MATVTYIRESKQSISAMKGGIDYCFQDKKSMMRFQIKDLSAELTVTVKMHSKSLWLLKSHTVKLTV